MLSRMTPALVLLGAMAVAAPATAEVKIGVFDPNEILTNSRLGQQLQEELNQFRVQQEAEIQGKSDELKRLMDQYRAGVETMSEERRESIEQDLLQRRRDLEREARDAQEDMERRRQRAVRQLEEQVASVIEDFGRRNGYTLILQKDLCAFVTDTIDVSADLIRLVDARPQ